MTLTARQPKDRPEDNRPTGQPAMPLAARGVDMRDWCEMCGQDVVLFGGTYSHAAPREVTCGTTPLPMKAAD